MVLISVCLVIRPSSNILVNREIALRVSRPSIAERLRAGSLEYATGLVCQVTVFSNKSAVGTLALDDWLILRRPVVFLSGRTPSEFLCVYQDDVRVELIAFDLSSQVRERPANQRLNLIIRQPTWKAERLLHADLEFAIKQLRTMSEADFKARSMPLKIFPLYWYYSRDEVIAALKEQADPRYGPP
jgi:hypothetical protein